jgi:DAK2 domain fusion protein YloV
MTVPTVSTEEQRSATGSELRGALLAASAWLDAQAERINALNVFPVPDGDTGTNMSLTLRASVDALRKLPETVSVGEVARAAYQAAMMGARGNSGVILSQLLRGFAHALEGKQDLTPYDLAAALTAASDVAYRGVSRPVEGTILTVARRAAEAAAEAAKLGEGLPLVLESTLRAAAEAVAETTNQLEVLRKAGVVDSGGEGYRVLLEGAWMWWTGRSIEEATTDGAPPHTRALLEAVAADEETPFGFCTEFLLRDCELPLDEVRSAMENLGESVIAVGDQALLRVHLHTLRPGRALEFAVDHGTVAKVKVENMMLQHQEMATGALQTSGTGAAGDHAPATSIGVIAVAAGEGFKQVFRSLGATVVEGGQTMNPSVQEILAAVNSSGYQQLIILPNNSNIIMTARHVKELTPHLIEVVPTETSPEGIGALLAFNFQADLQTNVDAMRQAAHAVHTIEATRSVRDAQVDGLAVRSGQSLGIFDGKVVAVDETPDRAVLQAFDHAPVQSLEIVTIYHGKGATQAAAHALASAIREAHPGLAVEVVSGGQPHYPYVVSLE